jgi:hypothetical protein
MSAELDLDLDNPEGLPDEDGSENDNENDNDHDHERDEEDVAQTVASMQSVSSKPKKRSEKKRKGRISNYGVYTREIRRQGLLPEGMIFREASGWIGARWKNEPQDVKDRYTQMANEEQRKIDLADGKIVDDVAEEPKKKSKSKKKRKEPEPAEQKSEPKKDVHKKKAKAAEEAVPLAAGTQVQARAFVEASAERWRPVGAYELFRKTVWEEFRDNRTHAPLDDQRLGSVIHDRWSKMGEEQRRPFVDLAQAHLAHSLSELLSSSETTKVLPAVTVPLKSKR